MVFLNIKFQKKNFHKFWSMSSRGRTDRKRTLHAGLESLCSETETPVEEELTEEEEGQSDYVVSDGGTL